MSDREFIDTNILVYAFDATAGKKRAVAMDLLDRLWSARSGCLSIQVLQEFYVTLTRKLVLPSRVALAQVEHLSKWKVHRPMSEDVLSAIRFHQAVKISFWNAMVVTSAKRLGCATVWSEDMSHGTDYDGVKIRNPFL